MRNITKTLFVVLSSFALSLNAFAGELSVSGTAKGSYVIGGATKHTSKGLGISNELNFTAAGELDSGYAWTYSMELDGGSSITNDDTAIKLTGDLGTFALCISECGLSTELSYGVGAVGTGSDAINVSTMTWGYDVSSYNNIQWHMPSGMLPFGIGFKAAYVPNLSGSAGDSGSAEGTSETRLVADDAYMYQITASPIEGLTVGGDYFESSGSVQTTTQDGQSGDVFFKYTTGPITVGAAETRSAVHAVKDVAGNYRVDTTAMGVQFAVNDALTISYNREKSELKKHTTLAKVEQEADSIQASYVIGGATIGIVQTEADDADYTTAREAKATLFQMALAF